MLSFSLVDSLRDYRRFRTIGLTLLKCFITLLYMLTGVTVGVLVTVETICRAHYRGLLSNGGRAPVICPLVKTDDSSVVVPAAEPCVSYSWLIYSLRLASGMSTLEQLASRAGLVSAD